MKSTRALIAFAYVADQFAKTNDLASGLAPLFAPVISNRAGRSFDSGQFALDVKEAYDLDMHPYVAEELAASLAGHGYLEEIRRSGSTVQYRNIKVELAEPPIREDQLRVLINGFSDFARTHLEKVALSAAEEEIEQAFLSRLVRPEFLALVLRPDKAEPGVNTLTLTRPQAGSDTTLQRTEEHFDFLVARYILNLHDQDAEEFDLLVSATSGALVAEVVIDLQHPLKKGEPLAGLQVAVDSPLILDALELGLEGAAPYAKQLIEQITRAGAIPIVFGNTVEEIQRALRSPLEHYERKQELYGPLGRRLRFNRALAPYVRAIIPKLADEIRGLGVQVRDVSDFSRAERQRYFTVAMEQALANSLGEYPTEDARLHDARAISDVLRLRGDNRGDSIRDAGIIFVTRNSRLARLCRRHLSDNALASRDYFPPCITDRYLAGLLWISTGGGGDSLSRLRLIANCSAAIVPRREIVTRMHRFFESLNPSMVSRFEALMTNERAEHFLMDRTIADSTLITQENYEEIYRDIEEVAAERVTLKKNEELSALQLSHAQQLSELTTSHREQLLQETTRSLGLQNAMQQEIGKREDLAKATEHIANQLSESELRWAHACLASGRRAVRIAWGTMITLLAGIAGLVALVLGDSIGQKAVAAGLTFLGTLALSVVGNRFWPDNPLDRWINRRRETAVTQYATLHNIMGIISKFTFDWEKYTVSRAIDNQRLPDELDVR